MYSSSNRMIDRRNLSRRVTAVADPVRTAFSSGVARPRPGR